MIITKDINEVSKCIEEKTNHLLKIKDKIILALPGGRSVGRLFEPLKKSGIKWSKVHIFMIDERLVSIDDPESNFKMVKEQLLDFLVNSGKLPEENIHPFIMEDEPDYGIKRYEDELKKYGGSYDISVFGIGEDGHIGALYPNLSIKDESDYFIILNNSPKPPKDRMTSSRKLLLKSKMGIFLFVGNGKRDAFEKFKNQKASITDCPAKLAYQIDSIIYDEV